MNQTDKGAGRRKAFSLGKVVVGLSLAARMGFGAEGPVLSTEGINPDAFGGPTELQDTFLPSQLRYQSYPESARVLPANGWSFEWNVDWTAHLARTDTYLFDGESITSTLRLRHSPWQDWEIGIDLPFSWRLNGSLDPFIEFVETTLNAKVDERYTLPRDTYQAAIITPQNRVVTIPKDYGLQDISLRLKRQLLRSEKGQFIDAAVTGTLALPSGYDTFGGEGASPGISFNIQKPVYHWLNLFAGAAGVYYSDSSFRGWEFNEVRGMTYAGLCVKPLSWAALVAEYQVYSPFAASNTPLNACAHYYSITGRFYADKTLSFEMGVVENLGLIENRNSSDVTFKWALRLEF
jgi:hypothetical protein